MRTSRAVRWIVVVVASGNEETHGMVHEIFCFPATLL